MKRLIAAAVLLCCIVVLCFTGTKSVRKYCTESKKMLLSSNSFSESDNWKALKDRQQKMEEYFHKKEKILCFFVGHDRLDEIESSLDKSRFYLKTRQYEKLAEEYSALSFLWKNLLNDQSIKIQTFA